MNVKSVLKITGIVFALIIALIVVLVTVVDANSLKPRIQALAAQQGIALNMRGDLGWAFWPAIGVAVNEVSIAGTENPQAILADVKKASLLVAFFPLLKGDLQIKHILVDGAVINLAVNEQGVGNWENIGKRQDAPTPAAQSQVSETSDEKTLTLSIEKISVNDSQVNYIDATKGSQIALSKIKLDVKDVNLEGKPFELDAAWDTRLNQTKAVEASAKDPLQFFTKVHSSLTMGEAFNSLALEKGELELVLNAKESTQFKVQYSLALKDIKNNLTYQGKLAIPALNAKQLIAAFGVPYKAANEKVLTDVSLASDFMGDKKSITFNALDLKVDKTRFGGSIAITDFASQALKVDLKVDDINADDYLPAPLPTPVPTTDGKAQVAVPSPSLTPTVTATGNEALVPVELLRKLRVNTKLAFNSIVLSKLRLEKVLLEANADQGLAQINLNTNAYGGNIHAKNTVDARAENPQLRFDVIAKGVNIAPILKDKGFDKKMQLSGNLHANANGHASGVSKNQILESLVGGFNFSGDQMRLASLNVEQEFCKLVNLVNKENGSQKTWNAYTDIQKLSGKATISKRVITVETVSGSVSKLLLGITGSINLINGSYDFLLPLKLNRDENDTPNRIMTSAQGCKVSSNYWVERSLTLLRCKGAYAQMDPAQDCRPDKDQLNGLIKDYAAFKLKEKHGEKFEEKKSELLKKLDDKLGGEGSAEKTKDVLKNLFKKKDDKPQDDK